MKQVIIGLTQDQIEKLRATANMSKTVRTAVELYMNYSEQSAGYQKLCSEIGYFELTNRLLSINVKLPPDMHAWLLTCPGGMSANVRRALDIYFKSDMRERDTAPRAKVKRTLHLNASGTSCMIDAYLEPWQVRLLKSLGGGSDHIATAVSACMAGKLQCAPDITPSNTERYRFYLNGRTYFDMVEQDVDISKYARQAVTAYYDWWYETGSCSLTRKNMSAEALTAARRGLERRIS